MVYVCGKNVWCCLLMLFGSLKILLWDENWLF